MEKLISKMKELGVTSITLDGYCGVVRLDNDKLVYDHKNSFRHYTDDAFAFSAASDLLCTNEDKIKDFKANVNTRFETELMYVDFDDSHYNHVETKYAWESDITDSGVEKDGTNICGNINQLRKFLSFACNHGRYSRSCYRYTNEKVNELLELGRKFCGLFEQYDSFGEYYHNATID